MQCPPNTYHTRSRKTKRPSVLGFLRRIKICTFAPPDTETSGPSIKAGAVQWLVAKPIVHLGVIVWCLSDTARRWQSLVTCEPCAGVQCILLFRQAPRRHPSVHHVLLGHTPTPQVRMSADSFAVSYFDMVLNLPSQALMHLMTTSPSQAGSY